MPSSACCFTADSSMPALGTEVIRELLPCMNGSAGADTVATLEREHAKLLDQARELEATADRLADILKSL
jgi:hypothetical protein